MPLAIVLFYRVVGIAVAGGAVIDRMRILANAADVVSPTQGQFHEGDHDPNGGAIFDRFESDPARPTRLTDGFGTREGVVAFRGRTAA